MWELPWDLPALSRWKELCESSPEPTATSLGKYYPRNPVRFQTRTRHYGRDFLCPSGAGEKCREQGRDLCLAFVDLTKAFE